MDANELKVRAYDLMAQINFLQNELMQVNNLIAQVSQDVEEK